MNLEALYKLQKMQIKLDALQGRLKESSGAKELARLKEEYLRLKGELSAGEEKLKRNNIQQEIKNNEIKNIQFSSKACEDIKFSRDTDTVKKLENIEKQLEKLDEKKKAAENEIIKLIEERDNINKALIETKKKMNFIKKKYMDLKDKSEKLSEESSKEIKELNSAIGEVLSKIDGESLEIYEKLRRSHKDPVAVVLNQRCGGCNVEVPAMDYDALKSGNTELRCQNCGRLLYKPAIA